jgi:hypothetical protein
MDGQENSKVHGLLLEKWWNVLPHSNPAINSLPGFLTDLTRTWNAPGVSEGIEKMLKKA